MAIITVSACQCDVCGHVWLKESDALPVCCPSRKCRSRLWNAGVRAPQSWMDAVENLRRDQIALSVSPRRIVREPILDKSGDYTQE